MNSFEARIRVAALMKVMGAPEEGCPECPRRLYRPWPNRAPIDSDGVRHSSSPGDRSDCERIVLDREAPNHVTALLVALSRGPVGECSRCGARIFWIVTKNGASSPYSAEGISHFADCPAAQSFRKPKPKGAV